MANRGAPYVTLVALRPCTGMRGSRHQPGDPFQVPAHAVGPYLSRKLARQAKVVAPPERKAEAEPPTGNGDAKPKPPADADTAPSDSSAGGDSGKDDEKKKAEEPPADDWPATLEELSVRKAYPLIRDCEDVDVLKRWLEPENTDEGRGTLVTMLVDKIAKLEEPEEPNDGGAE